MINLMQYMRRIALRTLTVGCLIGCVGPSCAAVHKNNLPDKQYISSEHELVGVSLETFRTDSSGARVYFESSCKSARKPNLLTLGSLPLPKIGIRSVPETQPPLIMAKQTFLGNGGVSAHINGSGLVVVEIGKVNKGVLETKLNSIQLNATQRYNPQLAIDKILNLATVQAAENRLELFLLPRPMDLQIVSPAPGLPHLPAQIRSMTLDKALDMVASTFHGVVIFGVCSRWGVYDVRFVAERAVPAM